MSTGTRVSFMDDPATRRTLVRMAREIAARTEDGEKLVLMGVHRRGVELSVLIGQELQAREGVTVHSGSIDITLYRDDLAEVGPRPVIGETVLPLQGVDDRTVWIIDDVLFTGRTVRAAMNEVMDWGRPSQIRLAVLIDRGGRELPVQADVVGRRVDAFPNQRVEVLVPEIDERLGVEIVTGGGE
jgi:pyrimidine operon attenuation protein/uracil phosphoribosyltransferase